MAKLNEYLTVGEAAGLRIMNRTSCRHEAVKLPTFVVSILVLLIFTGCNNSRYGIAHDRRLSSIKKIIILPASINIQSMHAGGVLEPRPDLIPGVMSRAVATARTEVTSHGREPTYVANDWEGPARDAVQPHMQLLSAIAESIKIHHYDHGSGRFFDYPSGDAISALLDGQDSDAVLLIYLTAVVPTAGRKALAGTALVVGVLTGIHLQVSTGQAFIAMMLVHRESGEILWYNAVQGTADVESERQLRNLVQKSCEFMLEPFDK